MKRQNRRPQTYGSLALNMIRKLFPGLPGSQYHDLLWCYTAFPFAPYSPTLKRQLKELKKKGKARVLQEFDDNEQLLSGSQGQKLQVRRLKREMRSRGCTPSHVRKAVRELRAEFQARTSGA